MSNNNDYLKQLNPEQLAAVTHGSGPLLIVAGAGTGKTSVITSRLAYLVLEGGCRPEEILALTFTDKAAGEMEERADRLLPYGYVDLWLNTFHGFAERILQQHGLEIGLPNEFKLLSATEQWLLVRKNLDRFNLDYYQPLGNPTKFIHALLRHFSRAKDENITPQDYLRYVEELRLNTDSPEFVRTVVGEEARAQLSAGELQEVLAQEIRRQEEIANAFHVYQQLLLENQALDFGDLINYAWRLLQERKNLLAQYRGQFKYILVDEFQDTNLAQYELIKLLAAPANNITVVGDDDQSIYKFRGASISNILQFKDDYPEAKEIFLNQNYRSGQKILDLSYAFIQKNNPYRLEVKLAGEKLSKKLQAAGSAVGEVAHLHGRTLADEVRLVVNKIGELRQQNPSVVWSDFAILVRANASAADFCYVLEQAGIPYNFLASKGLYGKKVILDLLAYFKLLDSHHESPALYRVLQLPQWGLSQAELIDLNYWAERKSWSLYETLRQLPTLSQIKPETRIKTDKVLALLERHSQLTRERKSVLEIAQAFLDEAGLLKNLTAADSASNREELNYLNQFFKKIQTWEKDQTGGELKDFLALIDLELTAGEEGSLDQSWEADADSVKVMTVHAAKGLEFKYVFIVNLVDKRFPAVAKSEPLDLPEKLVKEITPEGDAHLGEERRLFYVAMTRAKEQLFLSSADDYGGARKKKLSRFLSELSEVGLSLSPAAGLEQALAKTEPASQATAKIPTVPPRQRFSFTSLSDFEACPYRYRFSYILKVPTKGRAHFSFGGSMHRTLQKFFQLLLSRQASQQADLFGAVSVAGQPSLPELIAIYQDNFIDDWYASAQEKQKYFEQGREALKGFYQKYQGSWPRVRHLEYDFNWRLGGYTIHGVIDRLDQVDGGYRIVDYKTGQAKKQLSFDDKKQLLIYQLAVQEVMQEPVKELVFYYLNQNQELSFLGTDKELEKIKEQTLKLIEEINAGEFPPRPDQEKCKWCAFRNICDYRA